jgi:SAM-dependent methyltransferase
MCARLRLIPNAAVRQCDAARLPFRDGSFDTVIANHVLYHLDDPDAALREFARVLRLGGRLAVAVDGRDHLGELTAIGAAIGRPDIRIGAHNNAVTRRVTRPDQVRCVPFAMPEGQSTRTGLFMLANSLIESAM